MRIDRWPAVWLRLVFAVSPIASLALGWAGLATAQSFQEFPLPNAGSQPNGIVTGPDGNLWFTEVAGNRIGRMAPGGVITEFPLPTNSQGQSSQPVAILVGPDGALWFTMSNSSRIGRITTAGDLSLFITPTGGSGPEGIAVGSDGNLWFTEIAVNKIGRLTPGAAVSITEFPVPTPNSRPARIAAGPDGNLWFTESQTNPPANKIGRITVNGTIAEFPVPTANSEPWGITGTNLGGGTLVFSERAASKIGQMDTNGQVLLEFPTPTAASQPVRIIHGPDGNLWLTEFAGNNIARLSAGGITEFPVPTPASQPGGLAVGPDGAFWFSEEAGNKIGRFLPISSSTQLFASVLPSGRSVQVGKSVTAFATLINAGPATAHQCGIAPVTFVPLDNSSYQTTDPLTNQPIGTPNTPVDIPVTGRKTFVIAATPKAPFPPTELRLGFACTDANAAPIIAGVDTLLSSAATNPVPDIVALAATSTNNGVVNVPGANGIGAFSVATVNVGATSNITASANAGAAPLPVTVKICQSNPLTGQCLAPCENLCPSVTTTIDANGTPTFSVFVFGNGQVPFSPAINRIFVRFADGNGVVRGSTSVAVQTTP
jgi:virginiamycin B lyase